MLPNFRIASILLVFSRDDVCFCWAFCASDLVLLFFLLACGRQPPVVIHASADAATHP